MSQVVFPGNRWSWKYKVFVRDQHLWMGGDRSRMNRGRHQTAMRSQQNLGATQWSLWNEYWFSGVLRHAQRAGPFSASLICRLPLGRRFSVNEEDCQEQLARGCLLTVPHNCFDGPPWGDTCTAYLHSIPPCPPGRSGLNHLYQGSNLTTHTLLAISLPKPCHQHAMVSSLRHIHICFTFWDVNTKVANWFSWNVSVARLTGLIIIKDHQTTCHVLITYFRVSDLRW